MKAYLAMVLGTLAIVFVSGLIAGAILPSEVMCTEMACLCPESGEQNIECNSCYESKYVFSLGFFRAAKICPGAEVIFCEDGEATGGKIDWKEEECWLDIYRA
jgi:hypothetical protein